MNQPDDPNSRETLMEPITLVFRVADIPSLNTMYSANRHVRARIAKEAHEAIRYSVLEQLGTEIEPFDTPVSITIRGYMVRPMDTDNIPKALFDGLVYAGVLVDDDYKHLPEHHVYENKVDTAHERIEVLIMPI